MITTPEQDLIESFLQAVSTAEEQEGLSPEAISDLIGGAPSGPTIRRYMRGDLPKNRLAPDSRRGMERFVTGYDRPTAEGSVVREGWGATALRSASELGGATDTDLAELYRRLDRIEAEDIPAWLKVLRMDALSSAVRAEAMRMAERASSERAAAIRMAEEGAAERARAAGTEAEAALTRSLALQPTGESEGSEDVMKVAERVRRAGRAGGQPAGTPKRAAGE